MSDDVFDPYRLSNQINQQNALQGYALGGAFGGRSLSEMIEPDCPYGSATPEGYLWRQIARTEKAIKTSSDKIKDLQIQVQSHMNLHDSQVEQIAAFKAALAKLTGATNE